MVVRVVVKVVVKVVVRVVVRVVVEMRGGERREEEMRVEKTR